MARATTPGGSDSSIDGERHNRATVTGSPLIKSIDDERPGFTEHAGDGGAGSACDHVDAADLEWRGIRFTHVHTGAHARSRESYCTSSRSYPAAGVRIAVGQLGLALRSSRENNLLPHACCNVDPSVAAIDEMFNRLSWCG